MKKTYIKPDLFVEECMVEQFITTSGDNGNGTESVDINREPMEPAAKKHSGLWNDVWGDE